MNSVVSQNKLQFIAIDQQTAIGTATAPSASSLIIPASGISMVADQGRGLIKRANVMDGYPGAAPGVMGDIGYSCAFESEIHQLDDGVIPYYVRLALACGMQFVVSGGSYVGSPSTRQIAAWTQAAQGWAGSSPVAYSDSLYPSPLTIHKITNNNAVWDYAEHMHDSVGALTIGGESGAQLYLGCKFVGLVGEEGLVDDTDDDLANVGAYQTGYGTPIVVTGVTLTCTVGGEDISAPISKFLIDLGANTPLTRDARGTYGFAIAPSFVDAAPTLAFTLAENSTNYARVRNAYLAGTTGVFTVAMASGAQLHTISCPMTQFAGVPSISDQDGGRVFELAADLVRNPHSTDAPFTWTIDPTP